MSNFEYNRRRLTSITEIQGAALVLNTPAHQALSVDDMRPKTVVFDPSDCDGYAFAICGA